MLAVSLTLMLGLFFWKLHAETPAVLTIGQPMPSFELQAAMANDTIETKTLEDYRGSWVVLFYYPEDGTFVCPTELRGLHALREKFAELNVTVLPISTDTIESHMAWRSDLEPDFAFDWLADPEMKYTKSIGAFNPSEQVANRATYIIDPEGVLQTSMSYNNLIGRNSEELLRVIEALQAGGLCPMDWKKGDKLIDPEA